MWSSKLKHLSKMTPRLRAEDDGTTVTLPITGAQPKAGTGHKRYMYIVTCTLLGIYRWLEIYRLFFTFGSARWLIEILSAILKGTRHGGRRTVKRKIKAFWGTTCYPNLYDEWIFGDTNLRAITEEWKGLPNVWASKPREPCESCDPCKSCKREKLKRKRKF